VKSQLLFEAHTILNSVFDAHQFGEMREDNEKGFVDCRKKPRINNNFETERKLIECLAGLIET
jgi:hypothetical protein